MINPPDVPAYDDCDERGRLIEGPYWLRTCEYCGRDVYSEQPDIYRDQGDGDPDYEIEHDCPQAPPDEYA